jgi:hypothetical protein
VGLKHSPVWILQLFSNLVIIHLLTYEAGTECFETSAYKIQTPGNYPVENIQYTEKGESLKSRIYIYVFTLWYLKLFIYSKVDKGITGPEEVINEIQLFGLSNFREHSWIILTTDQLQAVGTQHCWVCEKLGTMLPMIA